MELDLPLLIMVPFWIAMIFINGKLTLELNREWAEQATRKEEEAEKR